MKVEIKKYKKGAFIYLESDTNYSHFYIIKSGKVQITRYNNLVGQIEEMRSEGFIFGIVQCVTGLPCEERAVAVTDCELLIIFRDRIEVMYQSHPRTILKIISEYSDILRKLDKELLVNIGTYENFDMRDRIFETAQAYFQIGQKEKAAHLLQSYSEEPQIPDKDRLRAKTLLQKLPQVKVVPYPNVINNRVYKAGEVIFTESELGNTFYIIKSGKVRISKLQKNEKKEMTIATLIGGDIFGEMAILNDKPRNATATMVESGELMVIKKDGIQSLPPSLFIKILMLLTRRIWMVQQQLVCCSTDSIQLKVYIFIAAKIRLKGFDIDKDKTKSCSLVLTMKEICETLGINEKEYREELDEIMTDKNLYFAEDDIKIKRIGGVADKCAYYSSQINHVS